MQFWTAEILNPNNPAVTEDSIRAAAANWDDLPAVVRSYMDIQPQGGGPRITPPPGLMANNYGTHSPFTPLLEGAWHMLQNLGGGPAAGGNAAGGNAAGGSTSSADLQASLMRIARRDESSKKVAKMAMQDMRRLKEDYQLHETAAGYDAGQETACDDAIYNTIDMLYST